VRADVLVTVHALLALC